ncbi:MAG: glycoside hydrolase family 2 TIM barrel-domain containing protein, partial [Sedimentisphaerales bacterium]|nr:glycoside hydrolase family 2 TIM barrel-domain containing protein [Sedimentisphaerales bacterium]
MRSRQVIEAIILMQLTMASHAAGQRWTQDFNAGWRFSKGPQGEEVLGLQFDDSAWQPVHLPHDWAITGPFEPNEDGYAGKLPWKGKGCYRKVFTIDKRYNGRRVYLDFDGVMAFPKVYVNGKLAGQWDYGYMSFRVDATAHVRFGDKNVVVVMADTTQHGTRWYPGAGIYRKVRMQICDPVHIGHWGVFITTPEITDGSATVRIQSTIENHRTDRVSLEVQHVIYDPDGKVVAKGGSQLAIDAGSQGTTDQLLLIKGPRLWDVVSPELYSVKTSLKVSGKSADEQTDTFGIRTFAFTADDGFYLNGRRLQLKGVCLHHDHGPLGAAFYRRAMARQLEIMRDMGVNAIRTSHNPPAPDLLDLCDRMGFVVWDEAFDKWNATADRLPGVPLEEYACKQIRSLAMRDRNHPCVVVWSIGNEIGEGGRDGVTPQRVAILADAFRQVDPTRPVGMACHIPSMAERPNFQALDLTGWNYARRYAIFRERYPDKPIIYSESASALSTRGFFELPLPRTKTDYSSRLQVNSYDLNAAPWSDIADAEFALMEQDRFVAGEFVWTGFDYLGEPTPFSRQARSSYFGIVDLCGIPKDRYYLYRSYWRPDTPTIHIVPHWNWPDRLGKVVPVFVYTNGDSAELFLNGKSLGIRKKGQVPPRPENLARNCKVTASSFEEGHPAEHAVDDTSQTRWTASGPDPNQWFQLDLGRVRNVRFLAIDFEWEEKNYGYVIKASADGQAWQTIVTKVTSREPMWGGPTEAFHEVDVDARFLRIEFQDLQGRVWASVREFGVYQQEVPSRYYDVTYRYRLRWDDVIYEPGELKAVAYKDGQRIGQAIVRTAGNPATLRLSPDRTELVASGEDLCYILVEAVDGTGTPCPLADNLVRFSIQGPAVIAGVGNGNPLSLEPFQADHRSLFNGKAILILRILEGPGGKIQVRATSEGLASAGLTLRARPARRTN